MNVIKKYALASLTALTLVSSGISQTIEPSVAERLLENYDARLDSIKMAYAEQVNYANSLFNRSIEDGLLDTLSSEAYCKHTIASSGLLKNMRLLQTSSMLRMPILKKWKMSITSWLTRT